MAAEGRDNCNCKSFWNFNGDTRRSDGASESPRRSPEGIPKAFAVVAAFCGHLRFRRSMRPTSTRILAVVVLAACSNERSSNSPAASDSAGANVTQPPSTVGGEEEPTQWTLREVAKRLTDGGLVVTDSGRTTIRHAFLAVEGHRLRVSGSDLQIFIYPDPRARTADSDRIDPARVAPGDGIIDWVARPHLIASGNLIAIHLTPNERLAERVRLILEAWHAES